MNPPLLRRTVSPLTHRLHSHFAPPLAALLWLTLTLTFIFTFSHPLPLQAATPTQRLLPEGFRPHIVFLVGEEEYDTKSTLPQFAQSELEPLGFRCTFVHCDPTNKNAFPQIREIDSANLLFISTRRRALSNPDLEVLRKYVRSGKPILGIRTASHAFDPMPFSPPNSPKPTPPPSANPSWPQFDDQILGADYQGHYGVGPTTRVTINPKASNHPILAGIPSEFTAPSHLYKHHNLATTVTPLLFGKTDDGKSELEPVAWINTAEDRKVFYTSLGTQPDFKSPHFRTLLRNAISWSLGIAPAP